jgi:magnesium-transporting ATPase (P-type)
LRDVGSVQTPVQRPSAVLGRRLAMAVSVAAVLVAVLNLAAARSAEVSLVLAMSLAVAAIPESLPAVVSLSLRDNVDSAISRGIDESDLGRIVAFAAAAVRCIASIAAEHRCLEHS